MTAQGVAFLVGGTTFLLPALMMCASVLEKTFFTRGTRMDLPVSHHAGIWGDLLLLPLVSAMIVIHMKPPRISHALLALAFGAAGSFAMHYLWAKDQWVYFLFEGGKPARLFADMTLAGCLHLIFIGLELALVGLYLVSPMPQYAVLAISGGLTIQLALGILQPSWYVSGKMSWGDFFAAAFILAGASFLKL